MLDQFDLDNLSAIITNAAGCGSHLKHFGKLLKGDADYAGKAALWDEKTKDISEWLCEIGFRKPAGERDVENTETITYHDACHLCHGQGISSEPRKILNAIPGVSLVELDDATHCCGSAGVYNITQPDQAGKLQKEKVACISKTGATTVATANPGCHLQIQNGLGGQTKVAHPVSLLAQAYRLEK